MSLEKIADNTAKRVNESVHISRVLFNASKRCCDPLNIKALQKMAIDEIIYASSLRLELTTKPETQGEDNH